jgi:hypothetical protein
MSEIGSRLPGYDVDVAVRNITSVFPCAIFKLGGFNRDYASLSIVLPGFNYSIKASVGADDETMVTRIEYQVATSNKNFSGCRNYTR